MILVREKQDNHLLQEKENTTLTVKSCWYIVLYFHAKFSNFSTRTHISRKLKH